MYRCQEKRPLTAFTTRAGLTSCRIIATSVRQSRSASSSSLVGASRGHYGGSGGRGGPAGVGGPGGSSEGDSIGRPKEPHSGNSKLSYVKALAGPVAAIICGVLGLWAFMSLSRGVTSAGEAIGAGVRVGGEAIGAGVHVGGEAIGTGVVGASANVRKGLHGLGAWIAVGGLLVALVCRCAGGGRGGGGSSRDARALAPASAATSVR